VFATCTFQSIGEFERICRSATARQRGMIKDATKSLKSGNRCSKKYHSGQGRASSNPIAKGLGQAGVAPGEIASRAAMAHQRLQQGARPHRRGAYGGV
jgi:hypothetical protein